MAWRSRGGGVTGDPIFPPAIAYHIMVSLLPEDYFFHAPPEDWCELKIAAKDNILTAWRVGADEAGEIWELAMAHPDMLPD